MANGSAGPDLSALDRAVLQSVNTGHRPLSENVLEITRMLDRNDFDVYRLQRLFESDPALTAQVLRVANSPVMANGRSVTSVREALVRLGSSAVQDIVYAVAMLEAFRDVDGVGRRIIEYGTECALVLRLMERFGFHEVPHLFLAGLMQDMGKLILLDKGGYATWSPEKIANDTATAARLEQEELGFDHATVGAVAVLSWRIPDPVAQVVTWHHQRPRALQEGGLVAQTVSMLHASKKLLRALDQCEDRLDRELADWLASDAAFQYCKLDARNIIDLADLILETEEHHSGAGRRAKDRSRSRGYRSPRLRLW